jgi:hypothetical protein
MVASPLFSIIVPVFNRGDCAATLVESLRRQSEPRWEALLVDDGSDAAARAAWTAATAGDARFVYTPRDRAPAGAPTCRNIGMERARGEYLIFLDCDDALGGPECLAERAAAMEAHPDVDFVVSPTRVFHRDPGDSPFLHSIDTGEDALDRLLARDIPWQTTGPTWRRAALQRVGPWDESLPSWQDWDQHVRALVAGLRHRRIDAGFSWWRQSPGSITTRMREANHLEASAALLERTAGRIAAAGLMTPRRDARLGLLWAWQAMECRRMGHALLAADALNAGRRLHPGPWWRWPLLSLHARTYPVPLIGRLLRPGIRLILGGDGLIPRRGSIGTHLIQGASPP